ncbi:MAG: HAD family phosphatase [Eubacterium sp.]|nr:HAD family phosphatase [Eubacterium sp.]
MEKTFENWLVVSDIDGTLNNKLRQLPERNYAAIKKFTDLGGNFTLASGRLTSSLKRNYDRVICNQPAIVLNGAGLYDFSKNEMVWRSTIGEAGQNFVRRVIENYSEIFKSLDIGVYFDDYVYIVKSGLFGKSTMKIDKAHYRIAGVDEVPTEGWMKVIFWGFPTTIDSLRRLIDRSDVRHEVNFMASSPYTIEMLARRTHKGVGIMQLANSIGIDRSHIAAIGDYYNDYDMLKTVGLPACAGQAPKAIHKLCKFEACHCNRGAVADLLEYIMSGKAEEAIAAEQNAANNK